MRKTTLLTLSLTFLITLPAMAQVSAQVGQVWTDFQSYAVDLQNYLRNNVSESFRPVDPQARSAISDATGELNIPNPLIAGEEIREDIVINSISDNFDNNSAVRGTIAGNEMNRYITRGSVVGFLGRSGQVRFKTKLEEVERTLEEIANPAEDSETLLDEVQEQISGISPEGNSLINQILGKLGILQASLQQETIRIQREQSKIVGESLAQTMQTNQFLQYSNINLANISQQVEETNRSRRVDTSAEAARLLRTTSQMDLFGRNLEN